MYFKLKKTRHSFTIKEKKKIHNSKINDLIFLSTINSFFYLTIFTGFKI